MTIEEKVFAYISKNQNWAQGLSLIRKILIETDLTEDIKWGMPTYRYGGKNVVSISAFKNHFGIWFHNGSFLKDEYNILENAQEGKTKGMRHLKYSAVAQMDPSILELYILEAIQNQKEGKEIKPSRTTKRLDMPCIISSNIPSQTLENLENLSIAKQNEYIKYITSAKREETKMKRLKKIIPLIDRGVGINDLYNSK